MKKNTFISEYSIIDTSEYDYNITQIMSNASSSILIKKDEEAKKWKFNIDDQKIDQYFDRIIVLCKRIYCSKELILPKNQILCVNGNEVKLYTYTDKFGLNQAPVSPIGFAYYDSILHNCALFGNDKNNGVYIQNIDGVAKTENLYYDFIKPFYFHNYFLAEKTMNIILLIAMEKRSYAQMQKK